MVFQDLRQFLELLEKDGKLIRIKEEVDPSLEMAEVLNRLLTEEGPAVIFENPKGHSIPVVSNLFGTMQRITTALGTDETGLEEIGEFIAALQSPKPPEGIIDAVKKVPFYANAMTLTPKTVKKPPCQEVIIEGDDVDLGKFPIMKCWPEDAGALITWPLVITKAPNRKRDVYNVGIYRLQVISKDRVIVRWLKQRGGAAHYRAWMDISQPMPITVAIGNDPATIIAAVTPLPESLSELHFAGILRKKAIAIANTIMEGMKVPATSEIVLEGEIMPGETAVEGPFGDHTGYYNPKEVYPVMRIKRITHRKNPLYLSTITGRPPREDAFIGLALNRIYLPVLKNSFPEIVDFHLPMEAISYRIGIISIKKAYPGHAKRIMMGLWGSLTQFLYVKFIIVVDADMNVRNWDDVIWAIATNVDPERDTTIIKNTPIDVLDFASPVPSLGSKMGIDATEKIGSETSREWGRKLKMDPEVIKKVDKLWEILGRCTL